MAIVGIVGLGNPGGHYEKHRHNVGFWLLDALAKQYDTSFKNEKKRFSETASITVNEGKVHLFKPTTYMNDCGRSVRNLFDFFKLDTKKLLVVHDDLDFPCGQARLKQGGGHGGHNGLRDIISQLGRDDFYRLRIGIGHPGASHLVSNYVLSKPSSEQKKQINQSIEKALSLMTQIISADFDSAMNQLHANNHGI